MKLKPAQSFLGCTSLLLGVEAIASVALIVEIGFIAVCSSSQPLQVLGFVVSPNLQVFAASWAFIGLPITVAGGVGVLHRIEGNVRLFFFYMAGSFVVGLLIPISLLTSKSLCDIIVDPEMQSQGTSFVCGFAETFVAAWTLMACLTHVYMVYIVWSAAEDIRLIPNPEMMRYEDALKSANLMPFEQQPTMPPQEQMATAAFPMPQPVSYGTGRPGGMAAPGGFGQGGPGGAGLAFQPAPMPPGR